MSDLVSHWSKFIGQPIYIVMARYAYVGILSEVYEKALVLANAHVVEDAGLGTDGTINSHHAIGSSFTAMIDAIEGVSQPVWCVNGSWKD